MAQVEYAAPWDRQPQEAVMANSFFPSPTFLVLPNGNIFQDVSGALISSAGTYVGNSAGIGVFGKGVKFSSGGWVSDSFSCSGNARSTYTLIASFEGTSTASATILASGTSLQLRIASNKLQLLQEGHSLKIQGVTTLDSGGHTVVLTAYIGGITELYCDGVLEGTWAGVIDVGPSDLSNMKLSRRNGTGETFNNSNTFFGAYYSGVRFPSDVARQCSSNPWQLFATQTIWVPVSAGGPPPSSLSQYYQNMIG